MKLRILCASLLMGAISFGQTQLYSNTFEGAPGFSLNTTDEGGTALGVNPWVVNNIYAGGSGTFMCLGFPFPFTVPGANTQPAGITNNPTSQYLHVTPQIAIDGGGTLPCASYLASDGVCVFGGESTFAAMTTDFSTVGYDSVSIDLWWMCGGHTDYYGELYYSTDAGSNWSSLICPGTGTNKWNAQTSWVNEALTDANLHGQATLRLGVRFVMGATTSGTFSDPGMAVDDITVTGYQLCAPTANTITETACYEYVSPSGNYTWTTTGMHNDTIMNVAGCDSVITVDLTINTVDTSVTEGTMMLTANATGGATYQWLDCNASYAVLGGATSADYMASNGDFAVEVTQNGCVDTSSCYTIAGLGVEENPLDGLVRLYPNPTEGDLFLEVSEDLGNYTIRITNVEGKVVQEKTGGHQGVINLNLEGERGIYFLEISFSEGELKHTYRVVKM